MLALFLLKGLLLLPVLGTCRYYERVIDRSIEPYHLLSTTILVLRYVVGSGGCHLTQSRRYISNGTRTGIRWYPMCRSPTTRKKRLTYYYLDKVRVDESTKNDCRCCLLGR